MYSFTDRHLAEQLASLARKGFRIPVYRDREQFTRERSVGNRHDDRHPACSGCRGSGQRREGSHALKSYAIDGRLLRTGSANWSPTGLKRQDNDVVYESSPEAVERFERKFEEMWVKPSNTIATVPER